MLLYCTTITTYVDTVTMGQSCILGIPAYIWWDLSTSVQQFRGLPGSPTCSIMPWTQKSPHRVERDLLLVHMSQPNYSKSVSALCHIHDMYIVFPLYAVKVISSFIPVFTLYILESWLYTECILNVCVPQQAAMMLSYRKPIDWPVWNIIKIITKPMVLCNPCYLSVVGCHSSVAEH